MARKRHIALAFIFLIVLNVGLASAVRSLKGVGGGGGGSGGGSGFGFGGGSGPGGGFGSGGGSGGGCVVAVSEGENGNRIREYGGGSGSVWWSWCVLGGGHGGVGGSGGEWNCSGLARLVVEEVQWWFGGGCGLWRSRWEGVALGGGGGVFLSRWYSGGVSAVVGRSLWCEEPGSAGIWLGLGWSYQVWRVIMDSGGLAVGLAGGPVVRCSGSGVVHVGVSVEGAAGGSAGSGVIQVEWVVMKWCVEGVAKWRWYPGGGGGLRSVSGEGGNSAVVPGVWWWFRRRCPVEEREWRGSSSVRVVFTWTGCHGSGVRGE
ncbi:uncharacterized protein A4U43_C04F3520 [Asparagus officinalis]|uniref:Glycine-rich protein n=1 Tax=Asparagus officinalis TaxID=4686 RepID=A0A5P1EYN6_ASPOF|nr:uncharacterized protein A4U43_C04F3520 [Asparagus officinalis]